MPSSTYNKALSILVITSSMSNQVLGRKIDYRLQGFTYRGLGFCENDQGSTFLYETIYDEDITTVGQCAEACSDMYSSDVNFSGINFLPPAINTQVLGEGKSGAAWHSRDANCNCMMGPREDSPGNGRQITRSDGIGDEICYSFDDAGLSTPPGFEADSHIVVDRYTFRGEGHCLNQRGLTLSYETIDGIDYVEDCGLACEDKYGSNSDFRGINFLPSFITSRRGVRPTFSQANCNCMMEERSGGEITSANGVNSELCYSFDGPGGEVSEHPAFAFKGFQFEGMGCCENDQGDFFSYETVPAYDIFECAETCEETFKHDSRFVGINFLLKDFTNCNCMLSEPGYGYGKITGASDVGCESEYCYSWDKASPSIAM